MGERWSGIAPAVEAVPALNGGREEKWSRFDDDSMNALSFGFVATAILISMFLVMAIFERFFCNRSPPSVNAQTRPTDLEAQVVYDGKPHYPSPKTVYGRGVSVLMPGEEIPTFIAHPAPAPCPPERILKPLHQHKLSRSCSPSSSSTLC